MKPPSESPRIPALSGIGLLLRRLAMA